MSQISYRFKLNTKYIPNLTNIKKLFSDLPNMKITFTNSFTVNNFFTKLKDKTPLFKDSHWVYVIECEGCHQIYIGETLQRLQDRIKGHVSDCRVDPKKCALASHIQKTGHTVTYDNTKVIYKETNLLKRKTLETLAIKATGAKINKKNDNKNCSLIYSGLLPKIRDNVNKILSKQ